MKAGPRRPATARSKRIARGVPSRMLADRAAELAAGPGGAGAADAGRHRRARDLRRATRARSRWPPPAWRWCCRHRRTPAPTTTPPFTTRGSCGWACRREEVPARAARRPGRARRRRAAGRGAISRRSAWCEIARVLRPGGRALLVVGDGVVDGRAENAPDGIAAAGAAGRARGGRARLAGAPAARPSPGGDFRRSAAPRAPAAARKTRDQSAFTLKRGSARRGSGGSPRLHSASLWGRRGTGSSSAFAASLESRRPQTIRAAAYASAEELPVPLRACVPPRLRHDTPDRTASMGFAGNSKRCCEPAHVRVDVPSRGTSAQSS